MSEDEKVVQGEQTSAEETTSKETEEKVEEKREEQSKEQPFSEEQEARMQQLMAQATSTAKEEGRREMQGTKDREVAEANRKTRLAQNEVASYKTGFDGLDEETRKDAELARYREQDKYHQFNAQEEEQRGQQVAQIQQMNDSITEEVKTWGIEPNDKRIDYASDAPDYFTGRKRFTDSLQKIVREKQTKTDGEQKEKFNNLETKLRKDLGLDSVDTTAGGGGGSDSDADFKKGIGDGSLPLNKTNMARAKKLGIA